MSRRQVIHARFHETLFIGGVGTLGDSLPSPSKTLQLEMWREANGDLELKINGRDYAVPAPNIKLVAYAPLPAVVEQEVPKAPIKKSK